MGLQSLSGKVVWLTGASSGIGEELARELARRGCRVVLTARRADALKRLASEIVQATARPEAALAFPADVTDRQAMLRIANEIPGRLGPVDILITSAGTYLPSDPLRFDSLEYNSIMRLNYSGMLYCIEAVLPAMIARRSGHIVGVASLSGYRGLPRACSYGASKAAMINFLEGLRFDLLRHQVDVTIVNPGFVKTPLTDKNDFPMPFLIEATKAARIIANGLERRKFEIHFPSAFSWILKLLRILPFSLYHSLVARKTLR